VRPKALLLDWAKQLRLSLTNLPQSVLAAVAALGLLSIATMWTAIIYEVHADSMQGYSRSLLAVVCD
jgi:hypothetical protein